MTHDHKPNKPADSLDDDIENLLSDLDLNESSESVGTATSPPALKTVGHSGVRASSGRYNFPEPLLGWASARGNGSILLEEAQALARRTDAKGRPVSHIASRERYCALHVELNVHGIQPPSLRPMRKRSPKAKGHDWDTLTRDNMILDLHWLHARGFRRTIDDSEFKDLLVGESFDVQAAERYVTKEWKTEIRVLRLGLTDVEQWQMAILVGNDVRKRFQALVEGERVVETKLRSLAQRGGKLQEDDAVDFAKLWFARELAAGATQDVIARVNGWRRGQPALTKPTMSPKLKKLQNWLLKAGV